MKLTAQATLQIQKNTAEVFEAIVNPDHMTQYFLSESSGLLESGKNLTWKFPEFEDEFPVTQVRIQAPNFICLGPRNHSKHFPECTGRPKYGGQSYGRR